MTKQNDAAFSAEHRQYIARLNRSRRGIKLARWLILIVFIALWELFARVGIIDPFIGSSPVRFRHGSRIDRRRTLYASAE